MCEVLFVFHLSFIWYGISYFNKARTIIRDVLKFFLCSYMPKAATKKSGCPATDERQDVRCP